MNTKATCDSRTAKDHAAENDRISDLIFEAIESNDAGAVAILVGLTSFDYSPYLIYAAEVGSVDCVVELIKHCDPKASGDNDVTALIAAAAKGQAECVKALLPVSDAKARDCRGMCALMHAVEQDCRLTYYIPENSDECAKLLIPHSDTNAQDDQGRTALIMAITETEYIDIVKLLLPHSNLELKDNEGRTALLNAACVANDFSSACVRLLLASKCSPNAQDNDGWTALMLAVEGGDARIIDPLLPDSDPRIRNNNGDKAATIALTFHDFDMARTLRILASEAQAKEDMAMLEAHIASPTNAGRKSVKSRL